MDEPGFCDRHGPHVGDCPECPTYQHQPVMRCAFPGCGGRFYGEAGSLRHEPPIAGSPEPAERERRT